MCPYKAERVAHCTSRLWSFKPRPLPYSGSYVGTAETWRGGFLAMWPTGPFQTSASLPWWQWENNVNMNLEVETTSAQVGHEHFFGFNSMAPPCPVQTLHVNSLYCDVALVSPLTREGRPQPSAASHDGAAIAVAERSKRAADPQLMRPGPQRLCVRPRMRSWRALEC